MKCLTDEERKRINLDMLCYFDKVCRANGIKYSLTGGTLLGAVRHKGFIPWDDDVDVFLTRPEFDKLETVFEDKQRYVWYSRKKDPTFGYVYGRLLDTKTIILDAGQMPSEGKGIFLDVCVVDGLPDNKILQKIHIKKMRMLYKGRRAVCFDRSSAAFYEKGKLISWFKKFLSQITEFEFWQTQMEREMKRYPFDNGKYVGNFTSQYGKKELLHHSVFDSYMDMEFEGKKMMVCQGWEEYLRNIYGDYMKLPPKEHQKSNHIGTAYLLEGNETWETVQQTRLL